MEKYLKNSLICKPILVFEPRQCTSNQVSDTSSGEPLVNTCIASGNYIKMMIFTHRMPYFVRRVKT